MKNIKIIFLKYEFFHKCMRIHKIKFLKFLILFNITSY